MKKKDYPNQYVVGVSGGVDSMVLLDTLRKASIDVIVCHVNYRRRATSLRDQKIVEDYCRQHNLPLYIKDDCNYDQSNFQKQAREIRYQFMAQIAKQFKIREMMVAHHLNDHIETYLIQKERKHFVAFYGIQSPTKLYGLIVHRPFLNCTKHEIEAQAVQRHLVYGQDETNDDIAYTRNRLRKTIDEKKLDTYLKEIDELNKQLKSSFEAAEQFLNQYQSPYLNIQQVKEFDLCFWLKYLERYAGDPSIRLGQTQFKEIKKLLLSKKAQVTIQLAVHIELIKAYDTIYVRNKKLAFESNYSYQFETFNEADHRFFQIKSQGHKNQGLFLSENDFPLTIRSPQKGDEILTCSGRKRISRLFIDAKVPNELRAQWPIVLNRLNEIILVPMLAKNKSYIYTKNNWFVIQLVNQQ